MLLNEAHKSGDVIIMVGKILEKVEGLEDESSRAADIRKEHYKAIEALNLQITVLTKTIEALDGRMKVAEATNTKVNKLFTRAEGVIWLFGLAGITVGGILAFGVDKIVEILK